MHTNDEACVGHLQGFQPMDHDDDVLFIYSLKHLYSAPSR